MQQCLVPQSAASNPNTPRCNKEENKSDLSSDINTTCLFTTADVSSVGRRLTRELPAALCFTIRCREARANERLRSRSHKKLCADAKHICCYSNPQRLLLNRLWARKTNRARADGETRPILEKLVPESCSTKTNCLSKKSIFTQPLTTSVWWVKLNRKFSTSCSRVPQVILLSQVCQRRGHNIRNHCQWKSVQLQSIILFHSDLLQHVAYNTSSIIALL